MSVIGSKKTLENLTHPNNIRDIVVGFKGVGQGDKSGYSRVAAPLDVKAMGSALSQVIGTKEAADALGISRQVINQANRGVLTPGVTSVELVEKSQSLKENIEEPIRKKALDVVRDAIEITAEKIREAKTAKESASVAKDLAGVYEKLAPKIANGASISFHYHAPKQRSIDEYVIKEV